MVVRYPAFPVQLASTQPGEPLSPQVSGLQKLPDAK